MQVMAEKVTTSSVTEIFPCSSGTDHHAKEVQETTVGPQTLAQPDPPQVSGSNFETFNNNLNCTPADMCLLNFSKQITKLKMY